MRLYRALSLAALPAVLAGATWSRKLRADPRERLGYGFGPAEFWLHGASAGDVLALRPLARALGDVHLTAITRSGLEAGAGLSISASPIDAPGPVRRAFDRIRPRVLVLELAELWPNLIDEARRRGVKLVLHNGRLRARGYRRLFALTRNLLADLDLLLMATAEDAERAIGLGAAPARVIVAGDTKADHSLEPPDPTVVASLRAWLGPGPLWVAGSTHPGEEAIVLAAFAEVRRVRPELRLLVAPRHVERGFPRPASRRTAPSAGEVFLLDTIGELKAAYALADVALVGGTFGARGGQNLLEPAALGVPVLFGPNTARVADQVEALANGGGRRVTAEGLAGEVLEALADRARRSVLARQAVAARPRVADANARRIRALFP